jgi:hypothetical protein
LGGIRTGTRTEGSFCRSSASCLTSQGTCERPCEALILNDKFCNMVDQNTISGKEDSADIKKGGILMDIYS